MMHEKLQHYTLHFFTVVISVLLAVLAVQWFVLPAASNEQVVADNDEVAVPDEAEVTDRTDAATTRTRPTPNRDEIQAGLSNFREAEDAYLELATEIDALFQADEPVPDEMYEELAILEEMRDEMRAELGDS